MGSLSVLAWLDLPLACSCKAVMTSWLALGHRQVNMLQSTSAAEGRWQGWGAIKPPYRGALVRKVSARLLVRWHNLWVTAIISNYFYF